MLLSTRHARQRASPWKQVHSVPRHAHTCTRTCARTYMCSTHLHTHACGTNTCVHAHARVLDKQGAMCATAVLGAECREGETGLQGCSWEAMLMRGWRLPRGRPAIVPVPRKLASAGTEGHGQAGASRKATRCLPGRAVRAGTPCTPGRWHSEIPEPLRAGSRLRPPEDGGGAGAESAQLPTRWRFRKRLTPTRSSQA